MSDVLGPPGSKPLVEGGRQVIPSDDVFADLTEAYTGTQRHIDNARLPPERRRERIRTRLEDKGDQAVQTGNNLGERLDAQQDADPVSFSEDELQAIGMTRERIEGKTKAQMLEEMRRKIAEYRQGQRDDIYTPARQVNLAQEGQRREQGENAYVALQAAFVRMGGNLIEQQRFVDGYRLAGSAFDEREAPPQTFVTRYYEAVADASLSERQVLEQTADVPDKSLNPKGFNADDALRIKQADPSTLTPAERAYRKVLDARERRQVIRQQEQAEAEKRRAEEAKRQKTEKHQTRETTWEEDTYEAAITCGRKHFESLRGREGSYSLSDEHIELPNREDRFYIPLGMIVSDPRFNEASKALSKSDYGPTGQLNALRLIAEDPQIFESVAQTLATRIKTDWTGFERSDYQGEAWLANWRTVLRRTIDGYAIGMLQAVTEMEIPSEQAEYQRHTTLMNIRRETVTRSFEIIFGELHMLDTSDVAKMNPFQLAARKQLGAYRKKLQSTLQSEVFGGYLVGEKELLSSAKASAKSRREQREGRRQRELAEKEGLTQNITKVLGEMQTAIATLHESHTSGRLAHGIARLNELRVLQADVATMRSDEYVEVSGKADNPQLKVKEKTREACIRNFNKIREQREALEGKPVKAEVDVRRLESLRIQEVEAEVGLAFFDELERKIEEINKGLTTVPKTGVLRGGTTLKFSRYRLHSDYRFGEMTDEAMIDFNKAVSEYMGPQGRLSRIETEMKGITETLPTAPSNEYLTKLFKQATELQRTLGSLSTDVKQYAEHLDTRKQELQYAVRIFLRDRLLPVLTSRGLVAS